MNASVVFGGYSENLTTTDKTHMCRLTSYFKKKKDDAFLRNTDNKHFVINVTLIELKKPGCNAHDVNAYYSYMLALILRS